MIFPTLDIENKLWKQGFHYVCGLDEVGRGCFAGPVVVGAVVFPQDVVLPEGVADSKLLTAKQRAQLEPRIKSLAVSWAIAEISVRDINKLGIGKATQKAFRKAVQSLSIKAEFILIDAFRIKHLSRKKQQPVKSGDKICASISAASIIAKVYRDGLMQKLHQKYPQYGFDKHKGYGTKQHQEAIKTYGLCRIHRRSFNLDKFL
ncbi:MAG: ribonuclease HII [Patescibacteria group bacterium]|nr:ribonuclease HII [Patescibacteria group bacterium]